MAYLLDDLKILDPSDTSFCNFSAHTDNIDFTCKNQSSAPCKTTLTSLFFGSML